YATGFYMSNHQNKKLKRKKRNASSTVIPKMSSNKNVIKGRWQFWLLLIITVSGFLFGYAQKGVLGGIGFGLVMYLLPFIVCIRGNLSLSKKQLSHFYKYTTQK
uniref:hypothetical protein n=1 Tax=Psychromonas sp. Urea-02u-13 TaxID=2058326 RepID=UPI000CC8C0E9